MREMWFDRFSTLTTVKKPSFLKAGKVRQCRNGNCTVVPSTHFFGSFKLCAVLLWDLSSNPILSGGRVFF